MDALLNIRQLFNSVSEIWLLVDTSGRVLLTSKYLDKFQHLINPPLATGNLIFDSIPDTWRALARNILMTLPHSKMPAMLEASVTDAGEKQTHFEIKCTAVRDDEGNIRAIFIEAADVTPQKIFEKKITIVAKEYQSLIENASAVIIGTDARGYITEWNQKAHEVTGFSKNESYIQRLGELLGCESYDGFSHAMNSALSGEVVSNYELVVRSKDDRKLTLLINVTPRTSPNGEVVGILLIGQDITELSAYRLSLEGKVKERTEALKAALENEKKLVEVKDRFVSMASHEFRSPISYIHRNIGLIWDHVETLKPDEIRQRLQKIQSQAEHLVSLLEDVLTMGKSGASNTRLKANVSHVDLKEFLHRIIDEVQSNMQHSHRINFECPVSKIVIESDEKLLRNVFVNLLTNAIKFSPGRDRVDLALVTSDSYVLCRVKDYGLGIEKDDLPRIFEPFHRGENVREIKGTGLGLPIVKKAIETLGGEVEVQSTPGIGTVFSVKLNLNKA
jgi:PAS domain S-box-containing protein